MIDSASFSNILAFDLAQSQLTLSGTQMSDEGLYQVQMRAFLVDYPSVENIINFEAEVDPCRVTNAVVSINDITYTIGTGQQIEDTLQISIEPPECDTYSSQLGYFGLPAFIKQSGNRLLLDSNDRSYTGTQALNLGVKYA